MFALVGVMLIFAGFLPYLFDYLNSRITGHNSWIFVAALVALTFCVAISPAIVMNYLGKRQKRANQSDSTHEMTSPTHDSKGIGLWIMIAIGVFWMIIGVANFQTNDPQYPVNSDNSLDILVAGIVMSVIGLGIILHQWLQKKKP